VVPEQVVNAVNVFPSLYLIATVYPVINDPPSAGATQLIKTLLPEIAVIGATGILGAVAVGITAPLPWRDVAERPTAFVAVTLA
jgi:hypothetical protein